MKLKKQKQIQVDVIHETGEIVVETIGFHGKGCIAASAALKAYLGVELVAELKPTYYEKDGVETTRFLPLCG